MKGAPIQQVFQQVVWLRLAHNARGRRTHTGFSPGFDTGLARRVGTERLSTRLGQKVGAERLASRWRHSNCADNQDSIKEALDVVTEHLYTVKTEGVQGVRSRLAKRQHQHQGWPARQRSDSAGPFKLGGKTAHECSEGLCTTEQQRSDSGEHFELRGKAAQGRNGLPEHFELSGKTA